MDKSLKTITISGALWSFVDIIVNQGISFSIQILLARLLIPEDFGLVGIVIAFIALARTIVDSGFTNALVREDDSTQEDYSTVFYYNIFVSLLIYAIFFFMAPYISRFYEDTRLISLIRVLSLSVVLSSVGAIQRTMIIKKLDFKSETLVNSISSFISGLLAVVAAYSGGGIWSLVIYNLSKDSIQSFLFIVINRWCPSLCFSLLSFNKYFNFGWKLLISNFIDAIHANINNLIIGKLYSKVQLGYYTNANKISNLFQSVVYSVVGKVSYPVLGKVKSNNEVLKNAFKKIIIFTSFVNFPIMIGLIVVADPLFMVLLGEKWGQAIPYFKVLCISGIIFPLQVINLNILQVKGRTDLFLKLTVLKKVSSILFISIIVIFKLDIMILLWIGVLDSFICYVFNSFYSFRLLGYSMIDQIKDISLILFLSLSMGILVTVFLKILNTSNIMELISSSIFGVITYIFLCKVFKVGILDYSWTLIKKVLFKEKLYSKEK